MAGADPHLRGADRVREVFARVANGDPGVADLYTEDGVVVHGSGDRVQGREAIRAFYQRAIDNEAPKPRLEAVIEAPPLYVAVVDVPTSTRHFRALDLFELDDEGIRRLEIYTQR